MMKVVTKSAMPSAGRPILMIGAGGIVNDAHLPAYALAGWTVAAITDLDPAKAHATAEKFGIGAVYSSVSDMVKNASDDVVYDIAVPGDALLGVLEQLPERAAVLMQKPMGSDFDSAKKILELCRSKQMNAGVNFQLRYAPFILAARDMIRQGLIGELVDIEVNVNVYTPWHLWEFLFTAPRVEIVYHSIHYLDLVRSFLGNPQGIYARTVQHPAMMDLASVRTAIIMDYGAVLRANILTNHCHDFGLTQQHSYIKFEGTRGAIKIKLGVLINYPHGTADGFEYVIREKGKEPEWKTLDIAGGWFPDAFIGSMAELMIAAERGGVPDNSVGDCIHTMACVEAAYASSAAGGTPLPS